MNRDFLIEKYRQIKARLGVFAGMAPIMEAAVKQIIVPIGTEDVANTRARAVQGKEFAAAYDALCDQIIADIDDDNGLDVGEIAGIVHKAMIVSDEAEDMATGVDEDKPATAG